MLLDVEHLHGLVVVGVMPEDEVELSMFPFVPTSLPLLDPIPELERDNTRRCSLLYWLLGPSFGKQFEAG